MLRGSFVDYSQREQHRDSARRRGRKCAARLSAAPPGASCPRSVARTRFIQGRVHGRIVVLDLPVYQPSQTILHIRGANRTSSSRKRGYGCWCGRRTIYADGAGSGTWGGTTGLLCFCRKQILRYIEDTIFIFSICVQVPSIFVRALSTFTEDGGHGGRGVESAKDVPQEIGQPWPSKRTLETSELCEGQLLLTLCSR